MSQSALKRKLRLKKLRFRRKHFCQQKYDGERDVTKNETHR